MHHSCELVLLAREIGECQKTNLVVGVSGRVVKMSRAPELDIVIAQHEMVAVSLVGKPLQRAIAVARDTEVQPAKKHVTTFLVDVAVGRVGVRPFHELGAVGQELFRVVDLTAVFEYGDLDTWTVRLYGGEAELKSRATAVGQDSDRGLHLP